MKTTAKLTAEAILPVALPKQTLHAAKGCALINMPVAASCFKYLMDLHFTEIGPILFSKKTTAVD